MLLHGKFRKSFPSVFSFLRSAKRKSRNIFRNYLSTESVLSKEDLIQDLIEAGITNDDLLMVHSSLRKIGKIENGANTLIEALLHCIGTNGTLAMPSFPIREDAATTIQKGNFTFDQLNTPSQMGMVTEIFRKMPGVKRSFHPTHPVCARGPLADHLTNSHFGELTPFSENSPFRKLCNQNGKILLIGVTMNQSLTNLHTLEDIKEFNLPVYLNTTYEVKMIDDNGNAHIMKTKVHDPTVSSTRDCDALKPIFIKENVLKEIQIGKAKCIVLDAYKLHQVMVDAYLANKVTMYHPLGIDSQA